MKTIHSKFYCIQPVQIDADSLPAFFSSKVDVNAIRSSAAGDQECHPRFKIIMDGLSNLYSSLVVLDLNFPFDAARLKEELRSEKFFVKGCTDISDYVNAEDTAVYLMFDYRLMQFVVLYEIDFLIPADDIDPLLLCDTNAADFYNCVRNIYVKEEDTSPVLPHIQELKNSILAYIRNYIETHFSLKVPADDIIIPNNSGNITVMVMLFDEDDEQYAQLSRKFIALNTCAERILNINAPIVIDDARGEGAFDEADYEKELYYFNGRFHTIIVRSPKNEFRFMPIQFHMQFLWFYMSRHINIVLEKYNDNILNDDSISNVVEYSEQIDHIINKVETLNIFNQKFKMAIEADSRIYYMIEDRWNVEDMIKGSNEYISFFKDYLARLYAKKNSKVEQRQNKILMFITLFQFVALVSVWTDYLSLLDNDLMAKAARFLPFFGGSRVLESINLYLPLGFLVIIFLMIVYIYRSRG